MKTNRISEEDKINLGEALRKTQVLTNDIAINTLIQDKKFLEIMENMAKVADACRTVATIMGKYAIQHAHETTRTSPESKGS